MMQNKTTDAAISNVTLDRDAKQPLFEQLAQALRQIILGGRLAPGSKLPSTRKLAVELSVSRVTVVTAYDQLTAEGYIESLHGSGAFVADGLPDSDAITAGNLPFVPDVKDPAPPGPLLPFQPTSPDMRLFPHKEWAKLFQRVWSNPSQNLLANADSLGWWPLRVQIAEHLRAWRGINCQPTQVIITSGASEAIQAIADSLLANGQSIAREDPGYALFSQVLRRAHINVQVVPVDDQGLRVNELTKLDPRPRGVIVTPSRQYPLGMTMPLARRLQLLKWAANDQRFVVEDDFDSEYRYVGQPLPALMSLAPDGTVIYMGSFSKVLSNSLRLGYLVVPQQMVEDFRATMHLNGSNAAGLAQPVLAKFIESGAYASHIRRMRRIYSARQKAFIASAQEHLQGLIDFNPAGGGMHLVGHIGNKLRGKMSDVEICALASQAGVVITPLSASYDGQNTKQGLIVGYAGFDEAQLQMAVQQLATILNAANQG